MGRGGGCKKGGVRGVGNGRGGGGGYKTGGERASEDIFLQKGVGGGGVLTMRNGGTKKLWGSFYAVA